MLQLTSHSRWVFVTGRSPLFSETLDQIIAELFRLITLDNAKAQFKLCTFGLQLKIKCSKRLKVGRQSVRDAVWQLSRSRWERRNRTTYCKLYIGCNRCCWLGISITAHFL